MNSKIIRFFTNEVLRVQLAVLLLPLIYAFIAISYPFPASFDLARFYKFYNVFINPTLDYGRIRSILIDTPDFTSRWMIYFFAKFGISINLFLFLITYITMFNFLFAFSYYYKKRHQKPPYAWMFWVIWMAVSVPAVLSGVRNIHALSFIALAFVLYRKRRYGWTWFCLVYAGLFHFSSWVIVFAFILYRLRYFRVDINRYWRTSLGIGVSLSVGSFFIFPHLRGLLPESVFGKINYYLIEHSEFLNKWSLFSWRGKIIYIFSYVVFPFGFFLFYIKKIKWSNLKMEITILTFCCGLFFLFPNTMDRFWMLLYVFMIANLLVQYQNIQRLRLYLMVVVFVFFYQNVILWLFVWNH